MYLKKINASFNSIQFILYSPLSKSTHLPQRALQSVHIDIPVSGPRIGSGKTPKKPFHREKREETFRRATEEDSSPRMDRRIDVT